MANVSTPHITTEDQERLARTLGISDAVGGETLTLSEMKTAVDADTTPEFASLGEAIRSDLEGRLDVDLLRSALSDLAAQIDRLPEVRERGIPRGEREPEVLYRELVEPGWRVYDHLQEVDFFESVDANASRFEPEYIRDTAHELIGADELTSALAEIGFDDREQTVLVMDIVNNNTRLSRWVPTAEIPEGVEFNVEFVPPLHQRAMGGALLWIRTLDVHLWQKRVLITERILDDGFWDIKAMLGGLYLLTMAALEVADATEAAITDSQLSAALTASAAILIVNQEDICSDMYHITEEMRAPSEAR
ncbi:hypothetical protein ACFQPA_15020 [Halomarina halobia]|uniref:Uncharacterized protein n=1 Tax=Halomarina halobia TaxID=3033386 RepID=A0ABD6A7N5_9EURY|nr:hypothetical protein [Halomarina sp. PSR21]